MRSFHWTVTLVVLAQVVLVLSAPYLQVYKDSEGGQVEDESRQAAQLVSGLVGTAVGAVTTPLLGPFAPALGTLIGNIIGQAISDATTMALGELESEDLLQTIESDAEEFPMKSYVINVPNVGPYVVMVRPEQSEGRRGEGRATDWRRVFPGTEDSSSGQEAEREEEKKDPQKRIEILPYSKLHFFKSH